MGHSVFRKVSELAQGASRAWAKYSTEVDTLQKQLTATLIGRAHYDTELEKLKIARTETILGLAADARQSYDNYLEYQEEQRHAETATVTADDVAAVTLLNQRQVIGQPELQNFFNRFVSENKVSLARRVYEIGLDKNVGLELNSNAIRVLNSEQGRDDKNNKTLHDFIETYEHEVLGDVESVELFETVVVQTVENIKAS